MEDTLTLFQSIGLSEAKAQDTIKNVLLSSALATLVLEVSWWPAYCSCSTVEPFLTL